MHNDRLTLKKFFCFFNFWGCYQNNQMHKSTCVLKIFLSGTIKHSTLNTAKKCSRKKFFWKVKKYIRKGRTPVHQWSHGPHQAASRRLDFFWPTRNGLSSEAPFSGPPRTQDPGSSQRKHGTCRGTGCQEPEKKIMKKISQDSQKMGVFKKCCAQTTDRLNLLNTECCGTQNGLEI